MKAVNRQCYSISDGLFNRNSRDPSSVWEGFPCLLLVVVMCPAGELPKKYKESRLSWRQGCWSGANWVCSSVRERRPRDCSLSLVLHGSAMWACTPRQCDGNTQNITKCLKSASTDTFDVAFQFPLSPLVAYSCIKTKRIHTLLNILLWNQKDKTMIYLMQGLIEEI